MDSSLLFFISLILSHQCLSFTLMLVVLCCSFESESLQWTALVKPGPEPLGKDEVPTESPGVPLF